MTKQARWKKRNPERVKKAAREQAARRYARDPEKIRAASRATYRKARRTPALRQKQVNKALKRHLRRMYGMSLAEFLALATKQGDCCAICKSSSADGLRLQVDHCHVSGTVRGLLCGPCNRGLGQFKDSPTRLAAALQYLQTPPK